VRKNNLKAVSRGLVGQWATFEQWLGSFTMKEVKVSTFDLQFADKETLKVEIINRMKLGPLANYVFNKGDPGHPVQTAYLRKVEKFQHDADPDPSYLSIRITFAEAV
jgi:hypothetical protein